MTADEGKGYGSLKTSAASPQEHCQDGRGAEEAENIGMVIDTAKCTRCGVCLRSCFYDAINLTKIEPCRFEEMRRVRMCAKSADVCSTCEAIRDEEVWIAGYLSTIS